MSENQSTGPTPALADPPADHSAPAPAKPIGSTRPSALVSSAEAARLCGLSKASWLRLEARGAIGPRPGRLGGRVLWPVEELLDWLRHRDARGNWPDRKQWDALRAARNGRDG